MREQILNSIIKIINKNDKNEIIIDSKELIFETSKYSSKKEPIWHLIINNTKIKKSTNYLFTYKCLKCNELNTVGSTQILRKIRQNKTSCFQCNNKDLNNNNYDRSIKNKEEKPKLSLLEKHELSKEEFEEYPDIYKHSYFLNHLSIDEYNRIKQSIISFGNNKYMDIDNYEFWPIYKVNNQMKFSSVLYDKINNSIFKSNQPILKCSNCTLEWRSKSIERFKNNYKILCNDCILCNRTFKIRPFKNINNEIITYQSKLELKFVKWCNNNNIYLKNGPKVLYFFNKKERVYKVNFMIKDVLIEIKDFHIWHKNQLKTGLFDEKISAVNKFIKENNLKKFILITPQNWNIMINDLLKIIK